MNSNEIYDEFKGKLIGAFLDDSAWNRTMNQMKYFLRKEQERIERIKQDNKRANAEYAYLRKASEK